MPEDKDRRIIPSKGGIWGDITTRIKLIFRLLADPRVSFLLKVLPVGSLFYFLFPDLAPGPVDDMLIIWLGAYLFVELCPPEVVEEHMRALTQTIPGEWRDADASKEDIVEAEFTEKKDED